MILIEDYRNLSGYTTAFLQRGAPALLGQDITVTTTAGTSYSGVMVEDGAETITLALRRRSDRQGKRVIIAKAHIVAVETALE